MPVISVMDNCSCSAEKKNEEDVALAKRVTTDRVNPPGAREPRASASSAGRRPGSTGYDWLSLFMFLVGVVHEYVNDIHSS